ncbi:MAG: FG-GAP-like repeat-containing protein [Flavobacteriales bacterium]|jgi:hypothetical protein
MTRVLLCLFSFFIYFPVSSQFTEVSSTYGIFIIQEGTMWGNGASFYDFNHDGWDDLTTADGSDAIRFFTNNNGTLQPSSFFINFTFSGQIIGLVWFDYDNDEDEDLLVSQWGGRLLLFQNDGLFNFSEIGQQAGFPLIAYNHFGIACADVDQDGFLDFAVAKYYNPDNQTSLLFGTRFFHNNGDGTFTDTTDSIGLLNGPLPTFQPVFFDVNEDGWLDMYMVVDRYQFPNRVYLNNGDGTFTLNQQFGLNISIDAMSCTMGDYDNDLDVDVFVANTPPGNFLMNNNNGIFSNVAVEAGVAVNQVCWGSNWIDYDNDSYLDLFVGNTNLSFNAVANRWFVNNHDGTFTDTPSLFGSLNDLDPTFCSVMGDVNNDGYYDYYNNNNDPRPCRFWLNDGGDNNYLSLSFEGTISNKNAFGTKVNLYANGTGYVKHTHCGESFLAQNSSKEIFGLNDVSLVDSLIITWPRGLVERYYNLNVNQHLHLIEGATYQNNLELIVDDTSICPGQTLTLDAGPGITWLWNNGANTRHLEVTEPGIYSCEISHDFNFVQNTNEVVVTLQEPPIPNEIIENVSCFDLNNGSIELLLDYPEQTVIEWENGEYGANRDSLDVGDYTYSVLSQNGCHFENSISIVQPDSLYLNFTTQNVSCNGLSDGGFQIIEIVGGTPEYQVTMEENSSLAAGDYSFELIDLVGCSETYQFTIFEPTSLAMDVYTVSNEIIQNIGASVSATGGTPPYTFLLNGDLIEDSTFYNLFDGDYQIEVFDANDCSVQSEFSLISEVEINVEENKFQMRLFEIGANGTTIFIQASELESPILIYNATGQLVYFSNTKEPIQMNEWAPGVYFISINNASEKFLVGR